jgi:hypothetical protein
VGAEIVTLSISLFGKFSVRANGVEIDLPSRKTRALIGTSFPSVPMMVRHLSP